MRTGGVRLFIGADRQDTEPTWTTIGRTHAERPRSIQPTPESRKISTSSHGDPSGVAVGGWTVLVVVLMAGLALVARRMLRGSALLGGHEAIRVLARRGLAPKQDLFLIEVGPRVFLIGATRDRLTTLGEFARPDDVAQVRSDCPTSGVAETEFRTALRETLRETERARSTAPTTAAPYADVAGDLAEIRKTIDGWRA